MYISIKNFTGKVNHSSLAIKESNWCNVFFKKFFFHNERRNVTLAGFLIDTANSELFLRFPINFVKCIIHIFDIIYIYSIKDSNFFFFFCNL